MTDEQGTDRSAPQNESPGEREKKKDPANRQDFSKPAEGRDKPPAKPVEEGKRGPRSPWLGGG